MDFLLTANSKLRCRPISHRFRDISTKISEINVLRRLKP